MYCIGGIITISSVLIYLLTRKLYKSKKRKSTREFTFQTLRELDVEDRLESTVTSGVEFPGAKSAERPALLTEYNENENVISDKISKSKKLPEDKKALLADSSQDLVAIEDVSDVGDSIELDPGNQTDL